MNKKFLFGIFASVLFASACTTPTYYQAYKAVPTSENFKTADNALVFENDECQIFYNFWGEGGNAGFTFFNKTDKLITVHKDRCFFVLNGAAFDYFQNRTYTSTAGVATSYGYGTAQRASNLYSPTVRTATAASGTSSSFSVERAETSELYIPAKSAKSLSEFTISDGLYRDCDLLKYPTRREIQPRTFTADSSPYVFENRLTYSIEGKSSEIDLTHKFYVSEITNYPSSMFINYRTESFCDEVLSVRSVFYTAFAPNKFYYKYTTTSAGLGKH